MKKVHLFAIAFLVGISAQATINTEHSSATPYGTLSRYLNTQSVTFVEDGVMYEVFLNGSFQFDLPHYQTNYRGRSAITRRGQVVRTTNRRLLGKRIFKDRFGTIHGIGRTEIGYNAYGRVNRIGSVRLRYSNGKLRQVGNMHIFYGHRSRVTHTTGNINRRNITYGVCGVGLSETIHYNRGRRGRVNTVRYAGVNQVNGHDWNYALNGRQSNDWDDDWDEDDDNDNYVRVGNRARH